MFELFTLFFLAAGQVACWLKGYSTFLNPEDVPRCSQTNRFRLKRSAKFIEYHEMFKATLDVNLKVFRNVVSKTFCFHALDLTCQRLNRKTRFHDQPRLPWFVAPLGPF